MPIEVHCPNPACARVHAVKNRYAGMRGKCPACGSWMYVPEHGQLPSMIAPRPEGLEKAAWAPETAKPAAREAADEPVLATLDEPAPARPRPPFSWLGAALVLLGMAGLGLVIAAPYLPKPELAGAAEAGEEGSMRNPKGIEAGEFHHFLQMLAPGVAAGALLCLLTALVMRRFDFPSLLLLYLTTVGAALVLLLALHTYRGEAKIVQRVRELAERRSAAGQGGVTMEPGWQLHALLGGAAGACALFLLAAVVVHRRWWSKLLGFLVLGLVIAAVPAWVYREEWGIAEYIPREVRDMMPF
jgi:hypothetical protein